MLGLLVGLLLYLGLFLLGRHFAPAGLLFQALLLGMVAAFVLLLPERQFLPLLRNFGAIGQKAAAVFFVALLEEGAKFVLLLYLYRPDKRLFCLLALALGLGFASAENIWYVVHYGMDSLFARLLSSSLLHLSLGLLVALKISRPQKIAALTTAILWHVCYNLALPLGRGLASVVLILLLLAVAWQLWHGFKT